VKARQISISGILGAAGVILSVLTATGFLGRMGWLPELTTHFRVQYLASLAVLSLAWAARRRWAGAAGFGLFTALNLAVVFPYLPTGSTEPPAVPHRLRVMLLNVHTENTHYDRVLALVRAADPDVFILEEVDSFWLQALRELRASYPHTLQSPRDDNFGMALFSKTPIERADTLSLGEAELPTLVVELVIAGQRVTVVGTHPLPPGSPANFRLRNAQLAALPQLLQTRPQPWIVLGDLNTTPWSPYFQRLLRDSGLVDTARGAGIRGTWPVGLPWMRIPIDHCLVSPELRVADRRRGPAVGSDHYPVIVDLELGDGAPAGAGATQRPSPGSENANAP
jgi:endonuclease/exonuclease/phosphatase (EEP) superfamily protein YafD